MLDEMAIRVNGEAVVLDTSGALWWPERRTLVLSDIHFEKGSSYARRGIFLPPYDSRAMLARIEKLQAKFRPARIIALGDSFHDMGAEDRFDDEERARLSAITAAQDWLWIAGNHDPEPPRVAQRRPRRGIARRRAPLPPRSLDPARAGRDRRPSASLPYGQPSRVARCAAAASSPTESAW